MRTAIVSPKYQVVIPKSLRAKLKVRPGQQVRVSLDKNSRIIIDTASIVDDLAGSLTGTWGKDPDDYINSLRDEAESHRR
jgi:AbrB family looped-hinge helix DNA binding protein